MRVAIIGYGLSGRVFHAPLISASPELTVTSIVTADSSRAEQARRDFPDAHVGPVGEFWGHARDHDLIVVATATSSHADLARKSIDLGVPVLVEKPLAPTAAEARSVVTRASACDVLLTVFHNRRWDSDHLTLLRLIDEGVLGQVMRYENRFERWRPVSDPDAWRETEPSGRGGGVLLDLGAHLVDQALSLFGRVVAVYGEVNSRRGGSDDDVFVALDHASGTRSHLWASAVSGAPGPRLRVLGRRAGFVVEELDGQEGSLRLGGRPEDDGFGEEPERKWGRLVRGDEEEVVASERGRWLEFYLDLSRALRGEGPPPVDPNDALVGLEVLDAARLSAERAEVVKLD